MTKMTLIYNVLSEYFLSSILLHLRPFNYDSKYFL